MVFTSFVTCFELHARSFVQNVCNSFGCHVKITLVETQSLGALSIFPILLNGATL